MFFKCLKYAKLKIIKNKIKLIKVKIIEYIKEIFLTRFRIYANYNSKIKKGTGEHCGISSKKQKIVSQWKLRWIHNNLAPIY